MSFVAFLRFLQDYGLYERLFAAAGGGEADTASAARARHLSGAGDLLLAQGTMRALTIFLEASQVRRPPAVAGVARAPVMCAGTLRATCR